MAKKTWHEKLAAANGLPKVEPLPALWAARRGGPGTLAIASPMEINTLMRKVPKGKLTTTAELREAVARLHHADEGCPLTTGIFSVIAANAAEEDRSAGKRRITPYWRTLKSNGELNDKYPGGIAGHAALLELEGHEVVYRGKRAFAADYREKLFRFAGIC